MSTVTRNLWRALLLVGTLGILWAASASAAGLASNVPCWKQLLNEWYSGKITTIYKHACYVQAINHLPVDVQVYSSARQDIEAAEVNASRDKPAPPEKTKLAAGGSTSPGTTTTNDSNPPKKKKGLIGILDDLTPGNPQSFPLPLLVLGALAILLVIAGGVGMIWQRTHPSDADPPQT